MLRNKGSASASTHNTRSKNKRRDAISNAIRNNAYAKQNGLGTDNKVLKLPASKSSEDDNKENHSPSVNLDPSTALQHVRTLERNVKRSEKEKSAIESLDITRQHFNRGHAMENEFLEGLRSVSK